MASTPPPAPPPGPPPPPPPGPPAGWYPDPTGQPNYLWWDGTRWTDDRAAMPPAVAPAVRNWGQQVRTPAGVFVLAEWGRRFGGYALDLLIVGLPLLVVDLAVGFAALLGATFGTTGNDIGEIRAEVVLIVVNIVVPSGYAFLFLRFGGRTLGMMAANVRAIDLASGGPLSTAQTWRRVLAFFFLVSIWSVVGVVVTFNVSGGSNWSVAFSYFALAGTLTTGLWPLWNASKQTLQDKAANTVVVNGWPRA